MSKDSKISESANLKNSNADAEFNRIKEGLKAFPNKAIDSIRQKVGAGEWKLTEIDAAIDEGKDSIDVVFTAIDGRKKEKYVIADISVPHLGIGQKYALPGKGKLFQQERKITAARIKKAIILIRKGTESISTSSLKLRCPIIELSYESLVKDQPKTNKTAKSNTKASDNRIHNKKNQEKPAQTSTSQTNNPGVSQELLFALKEAIVHECLSTMHKRCNKYIRKGLWRWIEREIMDSNIHFFLIILSSIYQGKTGEILSRRFKTTEAYSGKPDEIIDAIFSRENNLADEIKKSEERHRKALNKFLACFSQTPPCEYLKSIFLKEFRTHADGLKARMTVYTTLHQLLERCGFEGEKETRYPLEILDELKIFQGIMTGNYATLRTDNASKKLKHLVPQIEWNDEEIYQLRNQLAKALNLPGQEFNLNAFLPQAFFHDAQHMAETRKEAIRAHINQKQSNKANQESVNKINQTQLQSDKRNNNDERFTEDQQELSTPRRPRQRQLQETVPATENETVSDHDETRLHSEKITEDSNRSEPAISARNLIENRSPNHNQHEDKRRTSHDCDESKHRYFENFGGHLEEDSDAIRLALAMDRYRREKTEKVSEKVIIDEQVDDFELIGNTPMKPRLERTHTNMNMNPPKKSTGKSSGNNSSRTDRKRRFSKGHSQRNRIRKPSGTGVNR